MDIRIDIETKEPADVIHVSGRLVIPLMKQLTDVIELLEGNFVLDLSNLVFADSAGVDVIKSLLKNGTEVRGASTFINLLIDGDQS
jgi:anti-anti-sigma regulatory factor